MSCDVDFVEVPIRFPHQTRNRSFIVGRYQFVIGRYRRAQLLVDVRLIEFETVVDEKFGTAFLSHLKGQPIGIRPNFHFESLQIQRPALCRVAVNNALVRQFSGLALEVAKLFQPAKQHGHPTFLNADQGNP